MLGDTAGFEAMRSSIWRSCARESSASSASSWSSNGSGVSASGTPVLYGMIAVRSFVDEPA
jgi:hypothetical protein